MSTQYRTALQKWAKMRNTSITVDSTPFPADKTQITTTIRCALINVIYTCQKPAEQSIDDCEEELALKFLTDFRRSPVGLVRN